jgi:hypothetical protein
VTLERGLASGPIKFSQCKCDVAGLIGPRLLAIGWKDGAVWLDGIEIMAQHRSGHVETLLGKTVHAVVCW